MELATAPAYVSIPAVQQAIKTLQGQQVHPFFIAYLHLRAIARVQQRTDGLTPAWGALRPHLNMPGGPPGKPYYRPLHHRVNDPNNYWMNRNLAGSFAPRSLREGAVAKVVTVDDGRFTLHANHAHLAREHLLFGAQIPTVAFAAFWYRDYAIESDAEPASALRALVANDFALPGTRGDLAEIFSGSDDNTPLGVDVPLFEDADVDRRSLSWVGHSTARRSAEPTRHLSANDLGVGNEAAVATHASNRPDDTFRLPDDDPVLNEVLTLLEDEFGGIILVGPPGTSKTWYAAQIANRLTDNHDSRRRFIQFHPSYQYEDFMEGFVPRDDGTFELVPKHFVHLCEMATREPENTVVLVIDELSRGDVGRIFGEALTYIEKSKRGIPFFLASGRSCSVPPNLVILATMNPLDRGVDDIDAAFGRRFAKISMEPSAEILRRRLEGNGLDPDLIDGVVEFLGTMKKRASLNPAASIGHAYFHGVKDRDALRRVWRNQLSFLLESAYRNEPAVFAEIASEWDAIFGSE